MKPSRALMEVMFLMLAVGSQGYLPYMNRPFSRAISKRSFVSPFLVESPSADDNAGALLPPPDDLSDEVMLRIVLQETTDQETNELVWKYLGYRFDAQTGKWDNSNVFPNWRKKYPEPPDLIGVTRTYSREVDEPVWKPRRDTSSHLPCYQCVSLSSSTTLISC